MGVTAEGKEGDKDKTKKDKDAAVESTANLPVMEELDIPASKKELSKAINSYACGKAPGKDGILPEVIKPAVEFAKGGADLGNAHRHFCIKAEGKEGDKDKTKKDEDAAVESTANLPVMEELDIPASEKELSKAIDSYACGKAPGKDGILPKVIKAGKRTVLLHHLHQLLLQAGRSTIDMVFSLQQLQEKCWEQRQPLYVAFIDLTKAFDLISRKGLFTQLQS
ncbi:uncharacterized protein LOC143287199 [Babylonia areolata]|uniref:uncharacterized protein LOC143287199 n=1 Tax=Babylonia areolata TaxID=304850 RepID=UPI003FD161C0